MMVTVANYRGSLKMNKKGKISGVLIASMMAGSLLQVGGVANAKEQVTESTSNTMVQLETMDFSTYTDFDSDAYWAPAMKWAIDEKIITGYKNQKHPTDPKKGVGNWLNPNGYLTEYQMLTILLNYQEADRLKTEKMNTTKENLDKNFAFAEYKLAKDLGMDTRGSTTDATPASQQVTRGQLARALVSYIYENSVTLKQAIQFMYVNELTTGKNPAKGQTLDNFGIMDQLTRAQMVVFLERYVKKEELIDTRYTSMDSDFMANWQEKSQLVWGRSGAWLCNKRGSRS